MAIYKITVERQDEVIRVVGKDWRPVRETPEKSTIYDYTPETEKRVTENKMIYEQTVEDLDLIAVISAVNRLNVTTKEA